MKLGDLCLIKDTPGIIIYPGDDGNKPLIQTLSGRSYFETKDFKIVEHMDMELAQRFVPLLPESLFIVPYNNGLTGSDPEIFAFDEHGKVIPAWKFLPKTGTDTSPIYWDGVQGEFTIRPEYCHSYVTDNVQARLKQLYLTLKQYNPTATLVAQDVVQLDKEILDSSADEHINLGCSPSINAYPSINPIHIPDPRSHVYRYSGCHLHYSVSNHPTPDWFPYGTVVMMDKILGIALTALGRDMENPLRRVAYGRPGEYRVPGPNDCRLEYRTPGAFLLHHPALFNFAADLGRAAYRMGLQLDGRYHPLPDVKEAIIACDADHAWEIINSHRTIFEHLFTKLNYNVAGTMKLLRIGAKQSGLFGTNLISNWWLDKTTWISHNYNKNCNFYELSKLA